MIYLYAIKRRSALQLPEMKGLQNYPLEKIQVGELDAVISRCDALDTNPSSDVLWKHEGIIEALMKEQCVLPVRYGTCLGSNEELVRLIQTQGNSLQSDLERLNGCVEVSLRIIDSSKRRVEKKREEPPSESPVQSGGIEYLRKRLQLMNAVTEQQKEMNAWNLAIHDKLMTVSLDGSFDVHTHPVLMTTGAYLLKKERLHHFQELLGELRSENREYKFMCTGPWPPYNFVSSFSAN